MNDINKTEVNYNNKTSHILNTSSNLLGLCFIVLTSLRALKIKQAPIIIEVTAVATFSFMTSSFLSFLAIRSKNEKLAVKYENIAEFFFIIGLSIMFITTMVISMDLM